ncbi:MAG: VWA domain-containing protein [Planctomycetes bacterium]|nr:VWA domain-containing protein [Planctomycetota bacterium]
MSEVVFGRGELWPWLLTLPLLWALLWLVLDRTRAAMARYGARPTGPVPSPVMRSLRLTALLGLGFVCWLDPRWGDEVVAVERRGLDLIFCLDTSQSMLARDMAPTRLDRARRDIQAVLEHLEGGDRVGLVVFAGEARLWIPLTHDVASFAGLLAEVDTDITRTGGTDLAKALRRALEVADPDDVATTVVVLMTDGEDLAGAGQQAASELRDEGLTVYTVGYGSARGSKITIERDGEQRFLRDRDGNEVVSRMDPESLRALAAVTGGEFLRAEAMALPLVELHDKRLVPMQKRAYDAGEEAGKQARYQLVLLPLLVLLLLEIAFAHGRNR